MKFNDKYNNILLLHRILSYGFQDINILYV